jgi:mRNA-degrading endonuclease RelE of RelBE toxin-antitoxin system
MNLEISKAFVKDVEILPGRTKKMILAIIEEIQAAKTLHEINECAKLKGSDDLYRIRMGNYRMTFECQASSVVLKRVLPRGKIYKKHNLK